MKPKGDTMTSKTFLTTTALSLLLATSAFAQSDSTTATETEEAPIIEGTSDGSGTAPAPADGTMATDDTDGMASDGMEEPQSISEMTVGEFLGLDVVSDTGEDVGEIDYVIRGASEPEAVIGIGGFLGLGEYTVALPLSDFTFDAEDRTLMVNRTQEELESMPEFDESGVEGLEDDVQLSTLMQNDAGTSSTSGTTTMGTGTSDGTTSTDGMTDDAADSSSNDGMTSEDSAEEAEEEEEETTAPAD
jgi:hypothetical protein